MTRYSKGADGKYHIAGKTYEILIGSREQVWHGTACKTSGGLKKSDLVQNKHGRVVSKAKFASAKRDNRLVKAGYGTKKGKFGYVKLGSKRSSKRGGGHASYPSAYTDAPHFSGPVIPFEGSSSADINLMATNYSGGRRRRGSKSRSMSISRSMSRSRSMPRSMSMYRT